MKEQAKRQRKSCFCVALLLIEELLAMLQLNLSLLLGFILGGTLSAEILLGVSPRHSHDNAYEIARWEGKAKPVPRGWVGHPVDLVGISMGGAQNWGSIAEYGVSFLEEDCGWAGAEGKENIELSIALFPNGWKVGATGWQRALLNKSPNPVAEADKSLSKYERLNQGALPYLEYYRQLAVNLIVKGYGHSILRLGWEYNGEWFEWGDKKDLGPILVKGETYNHARAYRELFGQVHDAMMAVEGANFRWSWCTAVGAKGYRNPDGTSIDYMAWFPGVDKVDFISADYYDDEVRFYPGLVEGLNQETKLRLTWLTYLLQVEGVEVGLAPLLEDVGVEMNGRYPWAAHEFPVEQLNALNAEAFPTMDSLREFLVGKSYVTRGRQGLQWFRDLAVEKGLGFLVSEWGVWQNDPFEKPQIHYTGEDNPDFIKNFHAWLSRNDIPGQIVGAIYFEEFNDLSRAGARKGFNHSLLEGGVFPKSRQAYVDYFQKKGF